MLNKCVESIIQELYLSGVFTRNVNKIVHSLDIQISASYVPSLSSGLNKTVNEFIERKLDDCVNSYTFMIHTLK